MELANAITLLLQKTNTVAEDGLRLERKLLSILKSGFDISSNFGELSTFEFTHVTSGVTYVYVPGGEFSMGLSEEELSQAESIYSPCPISPEEMRPVHKATVSSFLIAKTPLTNIQANKIGVSVEGESNYPAFFSRHDADDVLNRIEASFPTEQQWEFICRSGTQSLFCFGDRLPEESELEKWLDWDISLPSLKVNQFGVGGLFFGEWCRDHYRDSYTQHSQPTEDYVIRGGGAYFWPWQSEEWVWCISAMRMPSSDLLDGTAVVRPVIDL